MHVQIISGQGTLVLELLSQVPDGRLDALVVPVCLLSTRLPLHADMVMPS